MLRLWPSNCARAASVSDKGPPPPMSRRADCGRSAASNAATKVATPLSLVRRPRYPKTTPLPVRLLRDVRTTGLCTTRSRSRIHAILLCSTATASETARTTSGGCRSMILFLIVLIARQLRQRVSHAPPFRFKRDERWQSSQ